MAMVRFSLVVYEVLLLGTQWLFRDSTSTIRKVTVLGAGLAGVAAARGVPALQVDAIKLPHQGSKGNVLEALVTIAPARHYVVSSNGDTFDHPGDEALARVVLHAPPAPTLWFNYRTARTKRWDDPDLRARWGHHTRYPADAALGLLAARPAGPRASVAASPGNRSTV